LTTGWVAGGLALEEEKIPDSVGEAVENRKVVAKKAPFGCFSICCMPPAEKHEIIDGESTPRSPLADEDFQEVLEFAGDFELKRGDFELLRGGSAAVSDAEEGSLGTDVFDADVTEAPSKPESLQSPVQDTHELSRGGDLDDYKVDAIASSRFSRDPYCE